MAISALRIILSPFSPQPISTPPTLHRPPRPRWPINSSLKTKRCVIRTSSFNNDKMEGVVEDATPSSPPSSQLISPVSSKSAITTEPTSMISWRKFAGEDNWSGLLDPLHPLLRAELIRHGELAQACYDAFDYDPFSVNCGSCKYDRRDLLASVGLPNGFGYDVTRYLYATTDNVRLPNFLRRPNPYDGSWSDRANWIGFVAVSDDPTTSRLGRRDIVVVWRGTVTRLEWLADLTNFLRAVTTEGIPCPDSAVKVQSGFLDLYTGREPGCRFTGYSAREQVLSEVRRLVYTYKEEEEVGISVTGHSLGSALATLCGYDIAETGVNAVEGRAAVPVCVHSFSGPRVGNGAFKKRFERVLKVRALRVWNVHDTVPKVPGLVANESLPEALMGIADWMLPLWSYRHVGVELRLDHSASPFLKETNDPLCSHNLEAHLHLLDGHEGKEGGAFELTSGRDPALVNKACDFLKGEHRVPPNWRQDLNRGLIRRDGKWVQLERRQDHDPDELLPRLRDLDLVRHRRTVSAISYRKQAPSQKVDRLMFCLLSLHPTTHVGSVRC